MIEDAAQAVGAKWDGRRACSIGDIACISFYPSKNLGAFGDAGMMTTNDDTLASSMRIIANHGSEKTYYHSRLGVNSRLDSIQAAILDVKLSFLDEWNARRREIAHLYTQILSQEQELIMTPHTVPEAEHIWHQYSILIRADREKVMSSLKEMGIPTNMYYPIPLHKQEAYKSTVQRSYPNAEYAAEHILSLPMHPELTDEDAAFIAEQVRETVKHYRQ